MHVVYFQCLNASDIFDEYFHISADTSLSVKQFENASLIITTFVYQMTNSCSINYRLDWPSVTYSYFVDQLMAIPDVSSLGKSGSLFTDEQLESLLRTVSESYLPGDQPSNNTRSDDVDTLCAVGNTKVLSRRHLP